MHKLLLLGHRGCRLPGITENSLAAFEYALAHGAEGFEFDVRYTLNGRTVLWHDPKWQGKTIGATADADLACGSGNRLARLEDVLQRFGGRAWLDIELKVAGNEAAVLAALSASPPQRGFLVTSFLPEVLRRLHDLNPDLPLGFICDRRDFLGLYRELPLRVLLPHQKLVTPQLIDEVHQHGLQIMTWTVNDQPRMLELAGQGIDGLISDDPGLLYQTFHTR